MIFTVLHLCMEDEEFEFMFITDFTYGLLENGKGCLNNHQALSDWRHLIATTISPLDRDDDLGVIPCEFELIKKIKRYVYILFVILKVIN